MRNRCLVLGLSLIVVSIGVPVAALAQVTVQGLDGPVRLERDPSGVVHIHAQSELDAVLAQGYVHARDRLFQMDVSRRTAEGKLAELAGSAALPTDVMFRILGVRRAAERSLSALSRPTQRALEAYAMGVNAYVQAAGLPVEYQALELTQFRQWTAADSAAVLKLITYQLSLDVEDVDRTLTLMAYAQAGAAQGFDGAALFLEDTNRLAPFEAVATVIEAGRPMAGLPAPPSSPGPPGPPGPPMGPPPAMQRSILELGQRLMDRIDRSSDLSRLFRRRDGQGSNQIAISPRASATGRPLLANDPHLPAQSPAFFIQNGLHTPQNVGLDVVGASFPGVPYVVLGQNRRIAWGATTNVLDVGDFFQEQVVADGGSPTGLSTVTNGQREPILALPQQYVANVIGNGQTDTMVPVGPEAGLPPAVLIVPRRNQGPIIEIDPAAGVALSLQYTGFGPTREMDAFRGFNLAASVSDFRTALQRFDVGSQNWVYVDVDNTVAYFTSGELPLREDLQAGTVAGLPPYFIRNGTGGNEWIPAQSQDGDRATPFEVLPFAELPQIVDPPRGFVVSANNDPAGGTFDNDPLDELRPGGGILYLSHTFAPGYRARKLIDLLDAELAAGRPISRDTLRRIQSDTTINDATVFTPVILQAFANATQPGASPQLASVAQDSRIVEAVGRLAAWDQSAPTGIPEGFDASDVDGNLASPSQAEIANSVAATIFMVWRNKITDNVIVATTQRAGLPLLANRAEPLVALRNLFDRFAERGGVGASGLDFFARPGIADPATRRDLIVLESLRDSLDLLASDAFASAFGRSTRQEDYRWGRLHRVVFAHPLGGPFSVPPALGTVAPPLPGLSGFPIDGGFGSIDVGSHLLQINTSDGFLAQLLPIFRYVGQVTHGGGAGGVTIVGETSLAGGQSGAFGSPFFSNTLRPYLTNETFPLAPTGGPAEIVVLTPARGRR